MPYKPYSVPILNVGGIQCNRRREVNMCNQRMHIQSWMGAGPKIVSQPKLILGSVKNRYFRPWMGVMFLKPVVHTVCILKDPLLL